MDAGRPHADIAAHLVDRVLPKVPVRQWVLTLPFRLRFRLAYDARLTSEILRLFIRVLFASLRRRARRRFDLFDPRCGAVTFVQRFGDALNLNLHFHTLVLDGVYVQDGANDVRFRPLPPPDDDEVARIGARIAHRLARLLERHGFGQDDQTGDVDSFFQDQPLLASLYGASVMQRVATGARAGQRVERLGDCVDADDIAVSHGTRCVSVAGVNLHANVCVPANDRFRLERLCRYVARPPIATERLKQLADGRLLYRLKHRWRDGTTRRRRPPDLHLPGSVRLGTTTGPS